jgi:hypothetical protein
MNSTIRGMQNTRSNMTYLHTCPTGGVQLIVSAILVPDSELLQFPSHVIGCTEVHVPVHVYSIRTGRRRRSLLRRPREGCVKPLEAAHNSVAFFATELAKYAWGKVGAAAATATTAAATKTAPSSCYRDCCCSIIYTSITL